MKPGDTLVMHAMSCPALLGGSQPCSCGGHTVTIFAPLDAKPDPFPWANIPPECITRPARDGEGRGEGC